MPSRKRRYEPVQVTLSREDREVIEAMLRGGVLPVRTVLRARCLLLLGAGHAVSFVVAATGIGRETVRRIAQRYASGGVQRAIFDAPRPGAEPLLSTRERQQIVAMVCSEPPEGHARWTVRLTAEHAVRRGIVPRVGRETVRLLLESHDLKPWREKNVVCKRADRRVHRADGGSAGALRASARSA